MDVSSPQPVESIEVDQVVKNEDAGEDADNTNDEGRVNEMGQDARKVTHEQLKALKGVADTLYNYKVTTKYNEDYYPSMIFRRVPNRRNLPDYYDIIKEPTAISALKQKTMSKKLTSIPEYVRDFALIVHNAQIYNRPNSGPVRDVLVLKSVFEEEMKKLVDQGIIAEEDTVFPDLGEIPYATPEPDPVSEEDDEVDEEGEDDDEDDDMDDSDDGKRKRRRRGRVSTAGRKATKEEDDDEGGKANDLDSRKRRGRPPRVDTPMEARIKAVLKGIRKLKDDAGQLKVLHFDKLPDRVQFPDYYQAIRKPICLDMIRRDVKRKKYSSLEAFMSDLDLMFKNAMDYNEDDSDIYRDAVDLKAEAHNLLEVEKAKSDDEYRMEDGRIPLPNGILHKNELWKIGDWIHLYNPNDITKPIVAQIYRTWQDMDGQKWINACWYYRPEQTVHQFEKHFYPDEVVKTGQYRDHRIEEVNEKCFVMFFTRYNKGRPRGLNSDLKIYVCEARYNEEKHKFNKIKTWASCLPDEVRDKDNDYEMDLFDVPRRIKKVPSPLSHLLKDEAKEADENPQPEWGQPNAPPLVGAIHRQSRDENQSPPPEPTPPPPTPIPQVARSQSNAGQSRSSGGLNIRPNTGMDLSQQPPRISPSMTPQIAPGYQGAAASGTPFFPRQNSYQTPGATHPYGNAMMTTPAQRQPLPYAAQAQSQPASSLGAAHPTNYAGATPSQNYPRPPLPVSHASPYPNAATGQSPRTADVWVLSDVANAAIPKHIRDQYPQDDEGRVLWFGTPPVDTRRELGGGVPGPNFVPLLHSKEYLKAKKERDAKIAARELERKRAIEESEPEPAPSKRPKGTEDILDHFRDAFPSWMGQWDEEQETTKKAEEAAKVTALVTRKLEKKVYLDDYDPRYGF